MFDGEVLAGFAGTSADAFTLLKIRGQMDEYKGNLTAQRSNWQGLADR
jgi:ATP-dependent protease HslVU (ClpYQ) peptidase subunit